MGTSETPQIEYQNEDGNWKPFTTGDTMTQSTIIPLVEDESEKRIFPPLTIVPEQDECHEVVLKLMYGDHEYGRIYVRHLGQVVAVDNDGFEAEIEIEPIVKGED